MLIIDCAAPGLKGPARQRGHWCRAWHDVRPWSHLPALTRSEIEGGLSSIDAVELDDAVGRGQEKDCWRTS
jgi:hypothetical protein